MKVNENLIWDYEFSPSQRETDAFKCWYIGRVLMRGAVADIQDIGVETIRAFLPRIQLPLGIHEFWEWFFQEVRPS